MGSWLKRQQPIRLYQASDVPFVILGDGAYLCFDNCYEEKHVESLHAISFQVDKNKLARISTNYYRIREFPVTIPFYDIDRLDDAVIDGQIIKHASVYDDDSSKKIIIIMSGYFDKIDSPSFDNLIEDIDKADHTFILAGEAADPKVRLFEGIAKIIRHYNWYKTSVEMADSISKLNRKYCWTSSLPPLDLYYYGLSSDDESDEIHKVIHDIGLQNYSIVWDD